MTKSRLIEEYLKEGKTLTCIEALRYFGTTELRSIISRLKKKGINIGYEWKEDFSKAVKFKEYFIDNCVDNVMKE